MNQFPFDIPESLRSYLNTFQESPEKGISNLEQYISRRRLDAVAFFLLASMYKSQGADEKARDTAARARALAPGSRLLEHLHYFLSHPDGFNAWVPEDVSPFPSNRRKDATSNLSYDLEALITRLTRAGTKRIKVSEQASETDLILRSDEVEALATPTLAQIYVKQGKIQEAIATYQRLCETRPAQTKAFEEQIAHLRTLSAAN
jgi:predicted Zn-dependent protease